MIKKSRPQCTGCEFLSEFLQSTHYFFLPFAGSGLGDLHFFGVAMLLLSLHKLHMVLTVGQLAQSFMLK